MFILVSHFGISLEAEKLALSFKLETHIVVSMGFNRQAALLTLNKSGNSLMND